MTTWMDKAQYVAQGATDEHYSKPVPRPDEYPETPSESLSYWIRDHPIDLDQTWASKPVPQDVDVVIVGSGITGAAAAYELSLKQPHLRVALLEARGICTGATGRNGGHVSRPECYELCTTAKARGDEETIRLRKFALKNRDMMLACIEELGIADKVDLRLNGTVVVFETASEREVFMEDMKFCENHNWQPENVCLSPEETVKKCGLEPSTAQYGAAFISRSGTIHPRKLVHSLLQIALERMPNLTLHPYNPALEVTCSSDKTAPSYTVRTKNGAITTRAIFHATNAYAGSICPDLHGTSGVFGCKAHMLAVQPNVKNCTKQLPIGFGYAKFWHWLHQRPQNGPFLYGLADAELLNDYNDTITLPADHEIRPKMTKFLETVFSPWFAEVDNSKDITHDWTGVQGFTMSGASIVGKVSVDSPGEFASVGHNGEGMTRCFASAFVAMGALMAFLDGKEFVTPEWFPHTFRRNI